MSVKPGPRLHSFSPQFISALFAFAAATLLFTSCKKDSQLIPSPAENAATVQLCESGGEVRAIPAQQNSAQRSLLGTTATNSVVTIPVVFHVVYNTSTQNISDLQIQSQIDVLNEDFNAANPDIANVPPAFAPMIGNAQIQFTLAKRDPSGNATTGITRTYTSVTSFSSNGDVCFAATGGHDAWPSNQYLNIWVCNKTGAAGSSSYPWSGLPATDGIIAGYNFIGRTGTFTNNWNYKKGRTITHEVGHWLGLGHIWGDATCGNDQVSDTPAQEAANGGTPVYPHLSNCSGNSPNGDMFMNYMDYTYDATRVMFTQGQVNRMNYYLTTSRAQILNSPGAVAPGTSASTCSVPAGLSASYVTSNGATISWTSTGASSYTIRYKLSTSSVWSTITSNSGTIQLSGLSPSSGYEVQVQSVCSSTSQSAFSGSYTFTTAAASVCNVPSGIIISGISSVSAAASWNSTGALSYSLRYKPSASTIWSTVSSTVNSASLTSLLQNTTYEVQVMSNCTGGSSSLWSTSVYFTTKKNRRKI